MILPGMDGVAIAKAMHDDRPYSKGYVLHKQARFEKKRLKALCYIIFEWRCRKSGNKYLVTIHSNLLKDPRTRAAIFCEVESDKGKIWFADSDLHDDVPGAFAYTSHFFNRYAERALHKKAKFPDVIGEFISRNYFNCLIWHNEDHSRGVYAGHSGLYLCSRRNNITYTNTFVSRDMLKETQLRAYDAIYDKLDYYDKFIPNRFKVNSSIDELLNMATAEKDLYDSTDICCEIYNEYFEK